MRQNKRIGSLVLLLLVVCVLAISGCSTMKGAGSGAATLGKNVADGAYQDWQVLQRWDQKFQEKVW